MDSAANVAAVILAAGSSVRMPGENKLFRSLGGKAVLERVVANARASGAEPVVVVSPDIAPGDVPGLSDTHLVVNPDPSGGMGTSIARGVQACSSDSAGYMIWPGDMPLITATTARLLIERGAKELSNRITVPVRGGRRGHPVLFGSEYRDDLSRLSGDRGARHLVEVASDRVVEVHVRDPGIFLDVDTENDMESARRLLEQIERTGDSWG